jgi:tRNA-splicing ligase RtcB (3'-phosphate/5'-hydroxy nucleic acid ligase)
MTKVNFEYMAHKGGHPIKAWIKGVDVEDQAIAQLQNVASLPFIYKHVAAMPDVHWGRGATIGSVIATKGAVVPAAVGVDLGCGMMALQTTITANDLPDQLDAMRSAIESVVPHGRTDNGGRGDRGAWHDLPDIVSTVWQGFESRYQLIAAKHPKAISSNNARHLGTLGTGNHFIEVCLDECDRVWVMLHSGSRGLGNRIGSYFIQKAKQEMERYFIDQFLPDQDLAYLVEHSELFDDYVEAVEFAQAFALANRKVMMKRTLEAVRSALPGLAVDVTEMAVNCHHNYIRRENHYGANVWVTRKGAVSAHAGELGIIPGSMGTASYIVRGKGSPDSFCSCSHGAGRRMSRGQARREITLEQHRAALKGISARLDAEVLDESPAAYKDIDQVMMAQTDLVDVVHSLRQVVNVKG